ncbi:ThiF family adenylyltransferase [Dysgonomonas capnocytophagoides]|nr:ThiF family adenylyltransferase [Dysgonomonas capnocytophagoides]
MLQQLLSHNQDVKRLVDEGFAVEINDRHICVHNVPYVSSNKEVALATLLCPFNITGYVITQVDHTMFSTGYFPCDREGTSLSKIFLDDHTHQVTQTITAQCKFSSRPTNGYKDFHEKFSTYIAILESEAQVLDPKIKAKSFAPIKLTSIDSVFHYLDTNSSRANIDFLNQKIENQKIAIIGLGGTGSYILDFVSKTPVGEIHIYDNDDFSTHNAFRCPGAAAAEVLKCDISKVDYLFGIYSNIHKHIIPHNEFVNDGNLSAFSKYDFVFVCVDNNKSRMNICSYLAESNVKYIDVGLGVNKIGDMLSASIRVSYPHKQNISVLKNHCGNGNQEDDLYASNIQIAELNAFNAVLAVMKWKRESSYYTGVDDYHTLTYNTSMNKIVYE